MVMQNGLSFCSVITSNAANTQAAAAVNIGIEIDVPPPSACIEIVPTAVPGYFGAPGYWRWDGNYHVCVEGRWIQAQPGYFWVSERGVPRGRRHRFDPGHWERDEEREHRGERERRG